MKPKVVDASSVVPTKRKSPVTALIESLGDEYKTVADVAEHFGVHKETVRRLIKAKNPDGTPKINAPSKAAQAGEMIIYLFTDEDMEELEEYFGKKSKVINTKE
jgi:transposase